MKQLTDLTATEAHTVITEEIFKHKHNMFEHLRQYNNSTLRAKEAAKWFAQCDCKEWNEYKAKRMSEGYNLESFAGFKMAEEYANRISKL